jgi:hypothetical protein
MIDWVESPNLNKSFCSDFSVHSENLTSLLINLKTCQDPKVWMKAQMMPPSESKIQYLRSIPHASSHYCMYISTEIIPYLVQICFWQMIWLLHFPTSSLVMKDPQIQLLHWFRVQVVKSAAKRRGVKGMEQLLQYDDTCGGEEQKDEVR